MAFVSRLEDYSHSLRSDPNFTRASDWLSAKRPGEGAEAFVVGVPFSELSLSGARCDLLPAAFRRMMSSFATYSARFEVDLADLQVVDLGDVDLSDRAGEDALAAVQSSLSSIAGGPPVLVVGGDNSITAPSLMGLVDTADASLVTLDAHHDVRDYKTTGLSNGSPVRVLIDAGLDPRRVVQIGIRDFANSRVYSEFARSEGIEVVPMEQVAERGIHWAVNHALGKLAPGSRLFVDVDVDVVDRALAPGAPASLPGGLLPGDLLEAAFQFGRHPSVVALDIVEVDPERDLGQATVRLACLVGLSFLCGVATRGPRPAQG